MKLKILFIQLLHALLEWSRLLQWKTLAHFYTPPAITLQALGPEREVEGKQRLGIISRALWGMPKKRRQLLMMSRFDGLSYAEIARQVGLSETVVRKHISNALADCHKALQAQG